MHKIIWMNFNKEINKSKKFNLIDKNESKVVLI